MIKIYRDVQFNIAWESNPKSCIVFHILSAASLSKNKNLDT